MKNSLLIIFLVVFLHSCHNVPVWQYQMFKRPPGNDAYPDEYIKGWQDGCESGAEASSNYLYRLKYKFRQDVSKIDNTLYINGWDSAYDHCRKYINQHNLNTLENTGS